ncbi:MAG TPA: hypothetical protein VFO12_11195 [Sphingomicrobium sp.]|nr:hypothetical protein [Sphingomicrobium sp.]
MKKLLLLSGLLIAAPAQATTGLICSTAGKAPIQLALAISHTAVPAVVSARLTDNRRDIPVVTAQSWFDQSEIRLDLVDRNAMRHEARLRATWRAASKSYDGSLWRNGTRRWIRCREG